MKTPQSGKKIVFHKIKNPSSEINIKRNNSQGNNGKNSESKYDFTDILQVPNTCEKLNKNKFINSPNGDTEKKQQKSNFETLSMYQTTPAKFNQPKFQMENFIQEENENKSNFTITKGSSSNYDDENVDEFYVKKSVYNDFYTDSIGEASSSFLDRGNKLINNLPKPFVKQNDRFEKNIEVESDRVKESLTTIPEESTLKFEVNSQMNPREINCRKLIQLAQKGDKENFLNVLEE